jgi:thioesterase domain-containing protein
LLVMLDSLNPRWFPRLTLSQRWSARFRHLALRWAHNVREYTRRSPSEALAHAAARLRLFRDAAMVAASQPFFDACVRAGRTPPAWLRDVRCAHRRIARSFVDAPIQAPMLLFRSAHPRAGVYRAPEMGWQGLSAHRTTLVEFPCDHLDLLDGERPNSIAREIESHLSSAAPD